MSDLKKQTSKKDEKTLKRSHYATYSTPLYILPYVGHKTWLLKEYKRIIYITDLVIR
jgi:hypothetical protein